MSSSELYVESEAYEAAVASARLFAVAPKTELIDGYAQPIQLPQRLLAPVYGLIQGLGGLKARLNYEGLPMRDIEAVRFDYAPAPVIVIRPRVAAEIVGMTDLGHAGELRLFTICYKKDASQWMTTIGFHRAGHAMRLWGGDYGISSTPDIMTFTSDVDGGANFYFRQPFLDDPASAVVMVLQECLFKHRSLDRTRVINVLQPRPEDELSDV